MEEMTNRTDDRVSSLPPAGDAGETTARDVLRALSDVRDALVGLRAARADINASIRRLVAQEAQLERMARIANEMLKEVNNDGDQGTGAVADVDDD